MSYSMNTKTCRRLAQTKNMGGERCRSDFDNKVDQMEFPLIPSTIMLKINFREERYL